AETVEPAPVTLTWAEQEVVDALKRLARAQSDLADLEARAAATTTHTFEAADVERLEQLQGPLAQARAKAGGRFGKAAARERLRGRGVGRGPGVAPAGGASLRAPPP